MSVWKIDDHVVQVTGEPTISTVADAKVLHPIGRSRPVVTGTGMKSQEMPFGVYAVSSQISVVAGLVANGAHVLEFPDTSRFDIFITEVSKPVYADNTATWQVNAILIGPAS